MIPLLVALIVLVLVLWVCSVLLPMTALPQPLQTVIYVVVVVIAVLWFVSRLAPLNLGLN